MTLVLIPLLAAVPGSPQVDASLAAGVSALDRKDLVTARSSFEQVVRLDPRHAGAWLLLAQTRARLNQRDPAVAAARKAEEFGARDPQILQGLANFYANMVPDFNKANQIGTLYATRTPSDTGAWLRLATYCLGAGHPREALAAGRHAIAVADTADLRMVLGNAAAAIKDWPEAVTHFSKARDLQPFDEQAHFALAQAYLQQQNFPAAIEAIERARRTFDKSPQLELALGVAYYGQRKFPEAVAQFFRTIALAPDVPQPYAFLGRMMDHLGSRMPETTKLFEAFQQRHPTSYLGYQLHAQALVAQLPAEGTPPELDAARKLLERSIELQPESAEAHYYLGVVLERQRQFAEAASHLERSIALRPSDSAAHFRLARVYDRLGRREDATRQRELHEKLSGEERVVKP